MLDRIDPLNRLFFGGRRYRIGMRLGLASTLSGAKELQASVRSGRSEWGDISHTVDEVRELGGCFEKRSEWSLFHGIRRRSEGDGGAEDEDREEEEDKKRRRGGGGEEEEEKRRRRKKKLTTSSQRRTTNKPSDKSQNTKPSKIINQRGRYL
jgi:hypothetical protein